MCNSEPSRKMDDPRYIAGISEYEDDMTDEEWFETMGPSPLKSAGSAEK